MLKPLLSCCVLAGVAGGAAGVPELTITTIARSGQPAPIGAGFTFEGMCGVPARINDSGNVAFTSIVDGPGVTTGNWQGLFFGSPGNYTTVARMGEVAPGAPGGLTYGAPSPNNAAFPQLVLTRGNELAYYGYLLTGGAWRLAVFTGPPGSELFVAGQGFAAPDIAPAANLAALEFPLVASPIATAGFKASVSGNGRVLYTAKEISQIAWLSTANDSLPGFLGNSWSWPDSLYINADSDIAFVASLGSPIPVGTRSVIYGGTLPFPNLVAREGSTAPDLLTSTYGQFDYDRLRIADGELIAFSCPISGLTDGAIFLGGFTNIRLFRADTEQAPGLPAGVLFDGLGTTRIELNGNAEVAFRSKLSGPGVTAANDSAIFQGPPNDIRLVVREGDPAPGGGTFTDLSGSGYLAYNDRRQVVFASSDGSRSALYASTPSGSLVLLAKQAAGFFTDDGFTASTSSINWGGPQLIPGSPECGGASAFNNSGQFVASLCFGGVNGSGVFLFDIQDSCPADVNADGGASPADFTAWLNCFSNPGDPGCERADVNGDGTIDPADFTAWLAAFNVGC